MMYLAALLVALIGLGLTVRASGRAVIVSHPTSAPPACEVCGRDPREQDQEQQRRDEEQVGRELLLGRVLLVAGLLGGAGLARAGGGPWWPLGVLVLGAAFALSLGPPVRRELSSPSVELLGLPCDHEESSGSSVRPSFLRE